MNVIFVHPLMKVDPLCANHPIFKNVFLMFVQESEGGRASETYQKESTPIQKRRTGVKLEGSGWKERC